jgi:hypothetical protein
MIADGTQDSRKDMSWVKIVRCWKRNVRINRRLLPSALAGIDRRLLLGSTVGSCRRLLLGSTVGSITCNREHDQAN